MPEQTAENEKEGHPFVLVLRWLMHEDEARYWQEEAQRLGTDLEALTHMCALANLSYQLRRRGHDPRICDELDTLIAGWASALGLHVVPRAAHDESSRQTFGPPRQGI